MKTPIERDQFIKEEIKEAVLKVMERGKFILGEELKALEAEVASFCGVKYAVGVASGTDALLLSLQALGIGAGDEVITTPFTFIATAEAIVNYGAKPVFVDIDKTKNIDASKIKVNHKTKAIIPVHLFGKLADMENLKILTYLFGVKIIEDAAQAFGTKGVGQGHCACFSFYPTKILGAYGDGGMVITNNEKIADNIKLLRNHGSSPTDKYNNLIIGHNSRLDEIQSAILRVKLRYFSGLKGGFTYEEDKYYPKPLHLQSAFKFLGYHKGSFPVAERFAAEVKNNLKK